MGFQWDPGKARTNARKHGVDFADAVGVLEDPFALTSSDPFGAEERYATVDLDLLGRVTVVHWTWRGKDVRLISARPATPGERRRYQEGSDHA